MLDRPYNQHLCYRLASTPAEVVELLEILPATVRACLEVDLVGSSAEAAKYDLATQIAYAFQRLSMGLACWTWADVRTNDEAERLLAAVSELDQPLNPLLACQLYTAATNRPSTLDP